MSTIKADMLCSDCTAVAEAHQEFDLLGQLANEHINKKSRSLQILILIREVRNIC